MKDTNWHIVVAEPYSASALDRLRAVARVTEVPSGDQASLAQALADCDALLVRTYTRVTGDILRQAPRLRVIGRGGVGLDNIDLPATAARGIRVVYTPAAATGAVADLAVGILISLIRGIPDSDRLVRADAFAEARKRQLGREVSSLTLGIVGMGRIGQAVAKRCHHGFGMRILFNDIVDVGDVGLPAEQKDKPDLYQQADVITLHVPLTNDTYHLINQDALAKMKPGAIIINTARGAVVDGIALADALCAGRIGGAGLDVFDPEPLPPDHPLWTAPNTVCTAHIGARTVAGQQRMNDVVDDVIRVLAGHPPRYPADTI